VKLVVGLVLSVVVILVLSYLAANGGGIVDVLDDVGGGSQKMTDGKPAYCFEQNDPDALKAAVDWMVDDYNAGKDVLGICAE